MSITCEIEYSDKRGVSDLCDVWIIRDGEVLSAYRNVTIDVNRLGIEIFRNNQGLLKSMMGLGNPDEVISVIYRNVIDEIIDKREKDEV